MIRGGNNSSFNSPQKVIYTDRTVFHNIIKKVRTTVFRRGVWMKDNRKEKRVNEENRIVIEYLADGEDSKKSKTINALTKDLSIGGARILTDKFFPSGTILNITLTLSRSRQIIKLQGKVKWVRGLYDGDLFEIGIEFLHDISKTVLALIGHLYGKEKGIPSIMRP
jgi:hypothetical protein